MHAGVTGPHLVAACPHDSLRDAGSAADDPTQGAEEAADAYAKALWDAAPEALPEHAADFAASLSSSWMGLHFHLHDSGLTPWQPRLFPWEQRRELAAIAYKPNVLQTKPHSLTVIVRDESDPAAAQQIWRP